MKTILAVSAAIMIASVASVSGHAAAQDGQRTVLVSYADLDLRQVAGRQALEHRIGHAVDKVCSPAPAGVDLTQTHDFQKCRSQAMVGAQQQLAQILSGRELAQASIRVRPSAR
jgi:UrcA family protein